MPLGTEVGLGPGAIVLDGDPAPPKERGTAAPTFRQLSIVAKWSPVSATVNSCFPKIEVVWSTCSNHVADDD